jgi:hypothetical protein
MIKPRRMKWIGHVALIEEKRTAHRILVGKPEGRRPLGRQRRRWLDNIKIYLREMVWIRLSGSVYGLVEGSCEHGN